jgi:hypothetical protein
MPKFIFVLTAQGFEIGRVGSDDRVEALKGLLAALADYGVNYPHVIVYEWTGHDLSYVGSARPLFGRVAALFHDDMARELIELGPEVLSAP